MDVLDPAIAAIQEFDRALAAWPRPGILGSLFARLDAVHSSGAEGTTTTFTDLMAFESSLHAAPDLEDAAVVAACAEAFDIAERQTADPTDLILTIHCRLFERSRDPMVASSAGAFKQRTNGTADRDAPDGFFYFTAPHSVADALREWREFTVARDPRVPEAVRQVLSHWMFEHIHPVADGNGRIGRLLVPLLLQAKGSTHSRCAFFGEAVHEDKQLYVEALKLARTSGDMTAWSRLMLGFLRLTADANRDRLRRLAKVEAAWARAIADFRSDSVVHKLAPFALTRPVFTIADALTAIGGTFASVNMAAHRLVAAGVLRIANSERRDRLFQAPDVLDIFDRFRPARQPRR